MEKKKVKAVVFFYDRLCKHVLIDRVLGSIQLNE